MSNTPPDFTIAVAVKGSHRIVNHLRTLGYKMVPILEVSTWPNFIMTDHELHFDKYGDPQYLVARGMSVLGVPVCKIRPDHWRYSAHEVASEAIQVATYVEGNAACEARMRAVLFPDWARVLSDATDARAATATLEALTDSPAPDDSPGPGPTPALDDSPGPTPGPDGSELL